MTALHRTPGRLAPVLGDDYLILSLARNALGHLELEARVNGRPALFLLDTGAARTVLAQARAEALGVACTVSSETAGGLGTAAHAFATGIADRLEFGALVLEQVPVWAMDLAHVNDALVARGGRPIDAVLGADLLEARGAVLDFANGELYLRRGGPGRGRED
jgi:clan AA aspartic protease (TIGR02281 family)